MQSLMPTPPKLLPTARSLRSPNVAAIASRAFCTLAPWPTTYCGMAFLWIAVLTNDGAPSRHRCFWTASTAMAATSSSAMLATSGAASLMPSAPPSMAVRRRLPSSWPPSNVKLSKMTPRSRSCILGGTRYPKPRSTPSSWPSNCMFTTATLQKSTFDSCACASGQLSSSRRARAWAGRALNTCAASSCPPPASCTATPSLFASAARELTRVPGTKVNLSPCVRCMWASMPSANVCSPPARLKTPLCAARRHAG
mmetsp:Transcript_8542/g.35619  ORF Transcript_8542/g.35619 Transcript_8542/m.35619 type:complete len:254 (-) Transcript_8542:660-1421(-)